ncbi:FAD-dependent oxidoreductase [Halostella sp. JP-L12]|uniref:oxidoreductase n=1 Tax=Halostella TaxID=1843185 RepID=UPI000EF802FA|nr:MULTISPECIES: FAD-dependent oxidoreductase [Halostella]NHN49125.1 FAD-dependent oxidoreductase [Halostella sp. JP-L12]
MDPDQAVLADGIPDEYEFDNLFEPTAVGDVDLRNRLMMTGHTTNYASGDEITQKLIDYYVERAEGGIGLIVMAYLANHPSSVSGSAIRGWDAETMVPQLRELTDAVHDAGAKIFCQNLHYGRQITSLQSERPVVSASDIPGPVNGEMPHELTTDEIAEIVEAYAHTSEIIQRGGFDGVEIHSGYGGYFLSQFISPYSNDRDDEYGGSLENRLRVVRETLDATRDRVGDDFVVGLQVNAKDFAPGGMDVDEYAEVARRLAATGQVDYLVVKAGTYLRQDYIVPDMQHEQELYAPLANRIAETVVSEDPEVSVATVGRVTDPRDADRILGEGGVDLVAMTRGHIADPAIAKKAKEGRLDELIECMGCNQGCIERIYDGAECRCVLNPATGFEADLGMGTLPEADEPRSLLVVGGGPGGMKAAEVAARMGHDVTLCERDETLGGQVRAAKEISGRDEFEKPILWLRAALDREGVAVETDTEVTRDLIEERDPDAVVVATGSSSPSFPRGYRSFGIEREDVPGWDEARVLSAADVLNGSGSGSGSGDDPPTAPGDRVLVVDDGEHHWKGIGTAKTLAEAGRDVHFAMPGADPGADLTGPTKAKLRADLFSLDDPVELHTFATVDAVEWPDVVLDKQGRSVRVENVDAVVLAGFRRAEDDLWRAVDDRPIELVGDAAAPRTIMEAIHEGERAVRELFG